MDGDGQVQIRSLVVCHVECGSLTKQQHTLLQCLFRLTYAMLDKTICALSNVFIGSSGSTFTQDIFRLGRGGWLGISVAL